MSAAKVYKHTGYVTVQWVGGCDVTNLYGSGRRLVHVCWDLVSAVKVYQHTCDAVTVRYVGVRYATGRGLLHVRWDFVYAMLQKYTNTLAIYTVGVWVTSATWG